MPADRLWASEDSNVYLGGLTSGSTELIRLALVEFSSRAHFVHAATGVDRTAVRFVR
jgi:hypothetical protein